MADTVRNYELMVVANPDLDEEGLSALNNRVAAWVAAGNGTLIGTSIWGRRRLAYPIRKQIEGIYIKYDLQLAPSATRELERNLRLDEQIMRHLVVRLN